MPFSYSLSIVYVVKFSTVLITLIVLFTCGQAHGEVLVGTGVSNVTGGRLSPLLYAGIDSTNRAFVFNSVGVKTSIYYHTTFQGGYYFQDDFGDFAWGKVRAGIGFSLMYSQRGYREDSNSVILERNDYVAGPAIRVRWEMFPLFFLAVESMYGVRNFIFLANSWQHTTNLILGVRF